MSDRLNNSTTMKTVVFLPYITYYTFRWILVGMRLESWEKQAWEKLPNAYQPIFVLNAKGTLT